MLLYLPLILTCSLFVGGAEGRVTWNRTDLEPFPAGVEPTWNRTDLTLGSQDCPGGYSLVGDQCLMFVNHLNLPHGEAREYCQAAEGELVAITTATDFKNLVDYIHDSDFLARTFWVDGTDGEAEGVWVTSSGGAVPFGTPFWAAFEYRQQPDNSAGSEHCLSLPSRWFHYMNDVLCTDAKNFICEATIQKEPEVASAALAPFGPSAVGVGCTLPFVEVGGLCLMFVTWAEETWHEARQVCASVSGDLLAIADVEVLRAVYLHIQTGGLSGHTFWLGGSDVESEGTWVYTTGEPVPMGTPFWGLSEMSAPVQEPNGGTSENCLAIGNFYNFRDYSCDSLFNPVCVYTG
ncbi:C-type lectin domain-containing protein [Gammaproteobacteria bacterium 2W06]|nr:C-type lectin domain-containing protein [Gammaproteobacteria bacterium 2W06]